MKTCNECNGKCCRYVAVETDKPKTKGDFNDIKWFLCHKNVVVYIDEEDDWIVEFKTLCKYLDENNKCKIYETRPNICRAHDPNDCDINSTGKPHKLLFKEPGDVDRYLAIKK